MSNHDAISEASKRLIQLDSQIRTKLQETTRDIRGVMELFTEFISKIADDSTAEDVRAAVCETVCAQGASLTLSIRDLALKLNQLDEFCRENAAEWVDAQKSFDATMFGYLAQMEHRISEMETGEGWKDDA